MAQAEFKGFNGSGFSLKDEKGRFAIPTDFRADMRLASDAKTLCLDAHPAWECAMAFGLSRAEDFDGLMAQARDDAREQGVKFDRYMAQASFSAYDKVNFDDSGRFTLPDDLVDLYGFTDAIYWHSVHDHIALFRPETLYALGPAFARLQLRCRRLEREARAKVASKGSAK